MYVMKKEMVVAKTTPRVTAQLMRDCSYERTRSANYPKADWRNEAAHLQLLRCRIAVNLADGHAEVDKGEWLGHGE
jgi:hypothetical protein